MKAPSPASRVLDALLASDHAMSVAELSQALGVADYALQSILTWLYRGHMVSREAPAPGRPARYRISKQLTIHLY